MRGSCVPFMVLDGAPCEKVCDLFGSSGASRFLTASLSARPSTVWPASLAITAFMTLPMSFGPGRAGFRDRRLDRLGDRGRVGGRRQVPLEEARSRPVRGRPDPAGPPARNCSTESRRCLTSELTTCSDSASSSARPFSTSRFISAPSASAAAPATPDPSAHRVGDVLGDLFEQCRHQDL